MVQDIRRQHTDVGFLGGNDGAVFYLTEVGSALEEQLFDEDLVVVSGELPGKQVRPYYVNRLVYSDLVQWEGMPRGVEAKMDSCAISLEFLQDVAVGL
jgi:hypothetical protein